MIRIFIGYDPRQPLAYNVLQHSIIANASQAVHISPLVLRTLPIKRRGLTEFTYSRYLVPYLCNYSGHAMFLDADMVVDSDIVELSFHSPMDCGVAVCKSKPSFEWPSAMLFNNTLCHKLTPDYVESQVPQNIADWSEGGIAEFPLEWNYCVGYDTAPITPKLIHYTAGIPIWPETKDCKFADVFHKYHKSMNSSVGYKELMGTSVHHKKVLDGSINA